MVETMAKLLYPDGREIGGWDKPAEAFATTKQVLAAGNCTLFEATVIDGKMLARHDIVQRFGKVLRLIEVKSSSVDSSVDADNPFRGKRGGIDSKWRPYLEDVTVVLRRAFPGFEVIPHIYRSSLAGLRGKSGDNMSSQLRDTTLVARWFGF